MCSPKHSEKQREIKGENAESFGGYPVFDQELRSTSICGPIELKFCSRVRYSWIQILDGGDQFWASRWCSW